MYVASEQPVQGDSVFVVFERVAEAASCARQAANDSHFEGAGR